MSASSHTHCRRGYRPANGRTALRRESGMTTLGLIILVAFVGSLLGGALVLTGVLRDRDDLKALARPFAWVVLVAAIVAGETFEEYTKSATGRVTLRVANGLIGTSLIDLAGLGVLDQQPRVVVCVSHRSWNMWRDDPDNPLPALLGGADVLIETESAEGYACGEDGGYLTALYTSLDEDLVEEAAVSGLATALGGSCRRVDFSLDQPGPHGVHPHTPRCQLPGCRLCQGNQPCL